MTCEPLARLLSLRRSRRARLPSWWVVALLFGVPALSAHVVMGEAGAVFVAVTTIGLLVGLPLYFFKTEVSLLASLRKGRCLEEMVAAGLRPAELIDTLALQSLIPIGQVCLRVWPILLLGCLLAPVPTRSWLGPLVLGWPLLVAGLFLWGAYLQMARDLARQRWGLGNLIVGLGAAMTLISMALVWRSPAGWVVLVPSLLLTPYLAREFAILGLSHPARLDVNDPGPLRIRGHRNRWVPVWSDNPIVARECARQSALPGGLTGLLLLRMLALIVPLAWGLTMSSNSWVEAAGWLWTGMPVVALLYLYRSSLRTLGAVVNERGQKTWEPLLQTGISQDEFRRGWLELGTWPYWLESLPVLALVLGVSLAVPITTILPSALMGLILAVGLMWLAWLGAYLGLAISSSSRNLQEASSTLMRQILLAGVVWLSLWGVTYFGGLALLAYRGYAGDVGRMWEDLAWHILPCAALTLVGWMGLAWSRRTLSSGLSQCEAPPPEKLSPATFRLCAGAGMLGGLASTVALRKIHGDLLLPVDYLTGPIIGLLVGWLLFCLRLWKLGKGFSGVLAGALAGGAVAAFLMLVGLDDLLYHRWLLELVRRLLPATATGALAGGLWVIFEAAWTELRTLGQELAPWEV